MVALFDAILSSSSNAFAILASALVFVKYKFVEPSVTLSVLTWPVPVPKSICVLSIPSVLIVTAPDVTVNSSELNEAIPLFVAVASSADMAPEDISMPSPALKCALTSAALGPVYVNTPEAES